MQARFRRGHFVVAVTLCAALLTASISHGQATATMLKLLQSGRLPPENQGRVIGMICDGGTREELRYIYEQAIAADGFVPEVRRTALEGLLKAANNRNVHPAGELGEVTKLLAADDSATQRLGIELVGAWQVEQAADALRALIVSDQAGPTTRQEALAALTALGPEAARATIDAMLAADQPRSLRYLGAGALASIDLDAAAKQGAAILADAAGAADPAPMLDAFLSLQGGPAKLAAAIDDNPPTQDVAKIALRHMYAMGRSDKPLVDALTKAAGIEQNLEPLTPEEQAVLVAEVLEKGDPARGEEIFRRADVNCVKCHAVSGAGGNVGPDLSPLGSTSPPEYVIRSILYPKEAVKEEYVTWTIYTVDGKIHQGIIKEENDQVVQLVDANGQLITVQVEDIDEKETTGSLMPEGLTNFLTHQEFLDLNRFVAELGKPGPYAVRNEESIQRWRVLQQTPPDVAGVVPDEAAIERLLALPAERWQPAYGKVAGDLPLTPLMAEERPELYLYGEVEVTQDGELNLQFDSPEGVTAWVAGQRLDEPGADNFTLERGTHKILFRVDPQRRDSNALRVVVDKTEGSAAEFSVVGGP